MGTRQEINLDYNRAISQARRLEEIASQLKGSASGCLEAAAGELAGGWKGDSGAIYLKKLSARQEKLASTASAIGKTARAIRQEAERIRRQELMSLGRK